MDNTERLERSTRRLEAGYQLTVETGKDFEREQIIYLMRSSDHDTWHFWYTSVVRPVERHAINLHDDQLICVPQIYLLKQYVKLM